MYDLMPEGFRRIRTFSGRRAHQERGFPERPGWRKRVAAGPDGMNPIDIPVRGEGDNSPIEGDALSLSPLSFQGCRHITATLAEGQALAPPPLAIGEIPCL